MEQAQQKAIGRIVWKRVCMLKDGPPKDPVPLRVQYDKTPSLLQEGAVFYLIHVSSKSVP
jgi:hypothetical protein